MEVTYKIIKEYDNYYLTQCSIGYKECFNKYEYKPIDGYIVPIIKHQGNYKGMRPEKVNKAFNVYIGGKK